MATHAQHGRVTKSDGKCLVLGVAKSGTTAMLYAIGQALNAPAFLFEEPISASRELPAGSAAKVIFEHEDPTAITRFAGRFQHRVMLLRDPRDNLISRLLYTIASSPELLKDDPWLADFTGAVRRKQEHPANVAVGQLLAMLDGTPGRALAKMLGITRRFAAFHSAEAKDWHTVRYEAMVAGNLTTLSAAIGRPIHDNPAIDPAYARVARTLSAGDWRHWFTPRDVTQLRPAFAPLLRRLGYDDDWELAAAPVIRPEHSSRYVLRLIEERRRHYGMPPFTIPAPRRRGLASPPRGDALQPCNICGGASFGPGPHGRRASNGRLPACSSCGSLERQRILRAAMHALPPGLLAAWRALAFGDGAGLQPAWFRSWLLVADIADAPGRPAASADLILLNHALEYVEDDRRAFDDIVRLLSPGGVLLVCFAAPEARAVCEHFTPAQGAPQVWHRYGTDLGRHFGCAERRLGLMRLSLADPSTGIIGPLHLFFKNQIDTVSFQRHFQAGDTEIAKQTGTAAD